MPTAYMHPWLYKQSLGYLSPAVVVEREDKVSLPGLALPDEVLSRPPVPVGHHQLRGVVARDHPVKPWILGQRPQVGDVLLIGGPILVRVPGVHCGLIVPLTFGCFHKYGVARGGLCADTVLPLIERRDGVGAAVGVVAAPATSPVPAGGRRGVAGVQCRGASISVMKQWHTAAVEVL